MKLKRYLIQEKTIQKTAKALAKKGYKLGTARTDPKKKKTEYLVMTPDKKAKWLTTDQILALIETEEIDEVRTSRPRAGGGKWGDFVTARLKYHQYLMDKKGMSSEEAFKEVKDLTPKDLKKMGWMK